MITTDLIAFYLVYYFLLCVLYKDNLMPNKIEGFAAIIPFKIGREFIQEVASCKFCMSWWVAVVCALIVCVSSNNPNYLTWAVYVTAINAHLNK